MIYEPREITCRDGRSCILRSAAVTDANDLIRYLKVTAGETPFLIREPDEISLTPEQEEHFIEGIVKEPRELMLIGTVAGEHVGNCSLMSLGNYERYAHRCSVAIALYQKYCGLRIGREMLSATAYLLYHTINRLSTTFLFFFCFFLRSALPVRCSRGQLVYTTICISDCQHSFYSFFKKFSRIFPSLSAALVIHAF